METANPISKTPIGQEPMPLEEAIKIIGAKLPSTMPSMTKEYTMQIEEYIKNGNYNKENKKTLAEAYQSMASQVCANQITEVGHFDPSVDFTILDDVQVFPGIEKGVEVCKSCHGLGGMIKFNKKPKTVQCLKCKTVKFTHKGQSFIIDDKTLTVDGVDKSNDRRYNWLFGHVVEVCARCNGTGRYKDTRVKNLVINVNCTTCKGERYQEDLEGSQVISKCKTCHGKQKLKIAVLVGSIKSITPCKTCSGTGFVKPQQTLDNPVLDKKLGKNLGVALSNM